MAYAITIGGRLYGYGAMRRRAMVVHLDDDEASEVASMLAAPAIRWA